MRTLSHWGKQSVTALLLLFLVSLGGTLQADDCTECQVNLGSITVFNVVSPANPCQRIFRVQPTFSEGCEPNVYIWDFGDGTVEISNNPPLHTYASSGTYQVTVTAVILGDNGNCQFTTGTTVTITQACTSECEECNQVAGYLVVDQTSNCTYDFSVQGFYSDCGTPSITWSFGDGQTGSSQYVQHQYGGTGPYVVCATITVNTPNGPCSKDVCTTVWPDECSGCSACEVDFEGIKVFKSPSDGCEFAFVTRPVIPNGCDVAAYIWNYGDGTEVIGSTNGYHIYNQPGTYTVSVTAVVIVDGERCEFTESIAVTAVCPPSCTLCNFEVGSIAIDRFGRCGYSFSAPDVSSTCGTITYAWDLGDGTNATTPTVDYTYAGANDGTAPQTVTLTVTLEENGQTCTQTISEVIWPECEDWCTYCNLTLGEIQVSPSPFDPCSYVFTVSPSSNCGTPDYYQWNSGNSNIGSGTNNPTATFNYPGPNDGSQTFTVQVTAILNVGDTVCEVTQTLEFAPDCNQRFKTSSPQVTAWTISPNPIHLGERLTVLTDEHLDLELLDLQGRVLARWEVLQNQEISLPATIPAGVYFLRDLGEASSTKRILIQR